MKNTMKLEVFYFLKEILSAGPKPANEVLAAARDRGISNRTLARVRKAIGVCAYRVGLGANGRWMLQAPWLRKRPGSGLRGNTRSLSPEARRRHRFGI